MLQIHLSENSDVSGGSVPISWCTDPETLKRLAGEKVVDPQVVIVVSPKDNYHSSKEYRKVVPLKDLMTWIEFKSSGENMVWAFISFHSRKDAKNCYLARSNGDYNTNILNYDGDGWGYFLSDDVDTSNVISVNVPTGVFAQEPPKWEKVWVNHFFRNKPQDQCDYRRRRLFAYTVQPVMMVFNLLFRVICLFLSSLWLSRGITLRYLLHPLRYDMDDCMEVLKGGSWLVVPDEEYESDISISYVFRKYWKLVFCPACLLFLSLAIRFHFVVTVAIIFALFVLAVCLALFSATGSFTKLWALMNRQVDYWYLEEMEVLTCSPETADRNTVQSVPRKYRTLNLRFQKLKSKVCRPFSA